MRRSMKIATTTVALVGLFALAGCTTDPSVAPPGAAGAPRAPPPAHPGFAPAGVGPA